MMQVATRIRRLAARGLSASEIADRLAVPPSRVETTLARSGSIGRPRKGVQTLSVTVPDELAERSRAWSRTYGQPVSKLVTDALELVLRGFEPVD